MIDYQNKTEVVYPEQLLAMLVSKVKRNAEMYLQSPIESCVITIPSCFTTQQRVTVEDSCKIAGFNEVRTINDTTAAAITYAIQKNNLNEGHYVLIFDIGATSTEASIAYIDKQSVVIKANAGEMNLGGDNFVMALVQYFIREFKTETKINLANDDQAVARLRVGCEDLKKVLSTSDSAKVTLETFYKENPYDLVMTRQIFELICADIFRKIIDVGRKLFQSTLIQKSAITATILVGGGTRIPKIQQDLKAFMHGEELSRVLNQDEAVATGAAYYATWGVQVEELPKAISLFGDCSGLDIAKMQQLLRKFEDDETALVDYMVQVNELEKLCYSYKRAIVKQEVMREDEDFVVNKCNQILTWVEDAQKNFFDRNDFRRLSKELKELYAYACNKKHESSLIEPNVDKVAPSKVELKIEDKAMDQVTENSGQELFDQGVALFTAENYKDASEIFTYFIQMSKQQTWPQKIVLHDLYSYRAQCHFYLKNYEKFSHDLSKIPKDRRTPVLKEMTEQATREMFMTRATDTLRKVPSYQRDAQSINIAISMLTSVLDTRPHPMNTYVEIRLTSQLLHHRSILHFQLRNYDQAINDTYQNMKLIHNNPDMSEHRDIIYDQLTPYLKTSPKSNELYKKYGQQTCEHYTHVKRCIKESKKTKNKGLFYCC